MEWTTRSHLHLDRTASAWLVRAFVDSGAKFVFIGWNVTPETDDPRSFGMPGVALSSHDENGTCFAKILTAYGLSTDQALMRLERGVAAGVRSALGLPPGRTETSDDAALGATLNSLGVGWGLLHDDDHRHLAAATPAYDALYQAFRAQNVDVADASVDRLRQIDFIRRQLGIEPTTATA